MIDVPQIVELQRTTVERWHDGPVDNPYQGFLHAVCAQHACNFRLWHEEDLARSPDADDARLARVKRAIDRLNRQRNDRIEALDELLLELLTQRSASPNPDVPPNTETPGSVIDRLSILSLRIHHLREALAGGAQDPPRRAEAERKLATCLEQLQDLTTALAGLIEDILAGRKRLKVYRRLKMYDDPMFNPYLRPKRT